MLKDKKLVILDMDGTLIDSVPSLAKAVNYTLKSLGLKELEEDRVRDFVGNGAQILIKRALLNKKEFREDEIDKNLYKRAINIFLDYYGKNLNADTTLYPGVLESLNELKNRGYKLAVATNKPHEFVGEMLEYFNLDRYLDYYIGAGLVENKKPHPDMLLKCCQDLKCNVNETVMVGDSINDIKAAKNMNMDVIALSYGYNGGIDLKELNPTIYCHNFKDILNYLI